MLYGKGTLLFTDYKAIVNPCHYILFGISYLTTLTSSGRKHYNIIKEVINTNLKNTSLSAKNTNYILIIPD